MKYTLIFLLFSLGVNAQTTPPCKDGAPVKYQLKATNGSIYYTNVSTSFPALKGGDTLEILAGNYSLIHLANFSGDPCRPIVITNAGGQVSVTGTPYGTIRLISARYFKFTGTGAAGIKNGFYAHDNGTSAGISVNGQSSDYIVEYCQFKNVGNGVFSKDQVNVNNPLTYTPGWEYRNAEYRFIDVDNTIGEAFYIGHSLTPSPCDNGNLMPIRYKNLKIHDCTVSNTGWDGIQVSLAGDSCLIYNNTITNYGWENKSSQNAGIVFGGYTTGRVFNNTIRVGTGGGVNVFGYGSIQVLNNKLDSCGNWKGTPKEAADQVYTPQPSIYINCKISSCLPAYVMPPLQVTVSGNCIQHISSYSAGAAIKNGSTTNAIAGTIKDNYIGDPLNRAVNTLIVSSKNDLQTGNVIGSCNVVPPVIPPVIPPVNPLIFQTDQKQVGDTLFLKIYKK